MARVDFFKKLSELLELPIHVIRAYVGPVRVQVKVAAKRVREGGAVGNRKRQNELYKQWRDASEEDEPLVAKELFKELIIHARNVLWRRIPESANSNLPRDMASKVMEKLEKFEGRAQFATWAHRIMLNLANLELRNRQANRERFVQYDPDNRDAFLAASGVPAGTIEQVEQRILLDRIKKELSTNEYGLLECMLDDMSAREIGEKYGIPEDNAESQQRRLINKLQKKFAAV